MSYDHTGELKLNEVFSI